MEQAAYRRRGWTPAFVERWLIAAFRAVPNAAVFSGSPAVKPSNTLSPEHLESLSWARRFVADKRDRDMLMSWARCKATGKSFGELCRDLGWSRATAERGRQRAVEAIAAALEAVAEQALDSEKGSLGVSTDDAGKDALAGA